MLARRAGAFLRRSKKCPQIPHISYSKDYVATTPDFALSIGFVAHFFSAGYTVASKCRVTPINTIVAIFLANLAMIVLLRHLLGWIDSSCRSRADLVLENLALHQQNIIGTIRIQLCAKSFSLEERSVLRRPTSETTNSLSVELLSASKRSCSERQANYHTYLGCAVALRACHYEGLTVG